MKYMRSTLVPVEVFYSFANADASLLKRLEHHLSVLQHDGVITTWNRRQIVAGSDWKIELDSHLNTASLILLLISPEFLASGYQYGIELQRAMQRHAAKEARVIPIVLRPCDWTHAPFGNLQGLPRQGKAVTSWHNRDEAFADIAREIRTVLGNVQQFAGGYSSNIWNVPHFRNPYYTGRDELLDQLVQQLSPDTQDNLAIPRRTALKGLGGIGKTQIAVEYAYRSRDLHRYTHIFWVNAASEEALITDFVGLAEILPSFPAKNETDQSKLVIAIKRWLEQCQQHWLLIFDNADDVPLVSNYLPQRGNGSVLLTTRADAVGSFALSSIEVETMGFVEGAHLLLRRAQRFEHASDETINEAINIVIALDDLPLAIDQAGAYIEETRCNFTDYLKIYQDHRKELLTRRGEQVVLYPDSVATTWSLAFQKIERANPAAAELLHLCAFLAPDKIPVELLMDGAPHWPSLLQQAAAALPTFNQMVRELLKFSLIKRLADEGVLSIHRLVQTVQRDIILAETQHQWVERVIRGVNKVFPADPNEVATWPQCGRYLAQVQACSNLMEQYTILLTEGADLLDRTGVYLDEHALYTIAEPLYERTVSIREQLLKVKLSETALSLNNRAEHERQQGKYEKAEVLYLRALAIYEQVDATDINIAGCLNNLGLLYYTLERYKEAGPLYERALAIYEQKLGDTHADTTRCLNNQANLYYTLGKYEEAGPLYERVLENWGRQEGITHPDMAISLNNQAELYRMQERYEEAEPLYQRALAIYEKEFVNEPHHNIALILNNLALLYHTQRKYEEAEPLYERARKIFEQTLGDMHPDTVGCLSNLANFYYTRGRYEDAEPLLKRAISSYEQIAGADNPYTQDLRRGYASLLQKMGRAAEGPEENP